MNQPKLTESMNAGARHLVVVLGMDAVWQVPRCLSTVTWYRYSCGDCQLMSAAVFNTNRR